MTNRLRVFIILMFLAVIPPAVQSQDTQDHNRLVIATTDNGPISIDRLLFVALRNIRYNVGFVCPIIREGYIQANEGTVDGVIAAHPAILSEYPNLRQVPVVLENINVRVFARNDSSLRINSWAELNGLRVGILENRTYILERLPGNVTITERTTNRAVLSGLVAGEYDVAVLVEREHETLGDRLDVKRIGQVDQLTEYLFLNRSHEALIPELTASLNSMIQNGSADWILNDFPLPELNQKNTILHINSYGIEIGRESLFKTELEKQFEDDISIEWMTLYLDARRFTRGQYNIAHIASLLRADSVSRNIAAVIVSGETALDFLTDYYYLYFRNTPVLFYGVSENYDEIIQDNEYFYTGIVKNIEAYETAEAGLAMFPDTKNIFVVNDYTNEGIQYRRAIENDLKRMETRVNITYNENTDIASLMEQINSLPQDTLVLVGSYFVDGEHQYFSLSDMKRLMERYCSVPVLSMHSVELAYNAIGGKCLDYQKYGAEIAGMLKILFDGGKAEDIPVVYDSSRFNRWVFDQNQMERFGTNTKMLPAGSEIRNKIPPVWESNPQFFIAMIILSIISVLLVIGTTIFVAVNHKYNKHLKEMEEAAITASRAKSNFLANMSHEMRTPLTAVLGLSELILETVQLDDETHLNLVKVYRSGETLLNLINDILDISKIEADKLELNPAEYDLPSLINDTITQSILYIESKPIKFILDLTADLPNSLYGDELRVKQIFNNLLSNAFKFTKEGKVELGIRCEREPAKADAKGADSIWMTAWVRDTGAGIKPEDISKLFTVYSKMEEENTRRDANRRIEGTGLGLSISKRVAEMMDGTITVESEYGKGSIFTVKLRQKYVNDSVIGETVVENLKKFHYSIEKFEKSRIKRINLSYANVLIVDDNITNLDVAKGLMSLYEMNIDCVTSGQEAIDAIREEKVKYNAVFMDHMMPEMDGIEATRIIREEINTEYAKNIPIIALTANAVAGNEEMFLNKGFQAFLPKPIELARLDAVVRQWIRDKNAEAVLPDQKIKTITAERERNLIKEDIKGLDVNKGIAHFGFNEELYLKILKSYAKNTKPLIENLNKIFAEKMSDKKMINYASAVHSIKGATYGIFAKDAGDLAYALEIAAKNNDVDFVNSNNYIFVNAVFELIDNIEKAIIQNGKNSKPVKDKIDDTLLSRFLKACINFDIDDMDAAMEEIEKYYYSSDNELAVWLREKLDQGAYKEIKSRLEK